MTEEDIKRVAENPELQNLYNECARQIARFWDATSDLERYLDDKLGKGDGQFMIDGTADHFQHVAASATMYGSEEVVDDLDYKNLLIELLHRSGHYTR